VQNRADAEALVKPAVKARACIREATRKWRECPSGSREAKAALAIMLAEQRRFRDALLALGVKHSNRWAEVVKTLNEPPLDEANRTNPEGCTRWWVEQIQKNPLKPPRALQQTQDGPGLLNEAAARFNLSHRGARRCYELAQDKTNNWNWRSGGRPEKKLAEKTIAPRP
jgi:hypothetical protein